MQCYFIYVFIEMLFFIIIYITGVILRKDYKLLLVHYIYINIYIYIYLKLNIYKLTIILFISVWKGIKIFSLQYTDNYHLSDPFVFFINLFVNILK